MKINKTVDTIEEINELIHLLEQEKEVISERKRQEMTKRFKAAITEVLNAGYTPIIYDYDNTCVRIDDTSVVTLEP